MATANWMRENWLGPDAISEDEAEWEVETSAGWVLWLGREKPSADYLKSERGLLPMYRGIRRRTAADKSSPGSPLGR